VPRRRRHPRIVAGRGAQGAQARRVARGNPGGDARGRQGGPGRASSTWTEVAVSIRCVTVRTCAAVAALVASAGCGASPADKPASGPPVKVQAASLQEGFGTMERLVEAARQEGALTVVGLPRDWANYGEIIDTFSDEYGIEVKQLEPGASSRRALDNAARLKPDVFDLTLEEAVNAAHRFAPYKVQGWLDLPDHVKDPSGAWYAAYGGYMSIGYDPRAVPAPASFADLAKPGYKVALDGDPLRSSAAFSGVMAASLQGGSPRPQQGVALFAKLKK